ncbi:MAG: SAM-dependent DNA methyltransferase [Verrucomicrobia bacterium]|nr:SAM-dependent DNA methyltransferase [Verrucomicrobiota bacterium]
MSKSIQYQTKAAKTKEAASLAVLSGEQLEHRRAEVNTAIKTACDYLNSDGVDPRNYVEQLAWMFFLKAFDEAEAVRADVAVFEDKMVENRLPVELRWATWSKMTDRPDDMLKLVNDKVWPKLLSLGTDPVAQRFQRIFSTVRNYCRRGVIFAKVVDQVNKLHFSDRTDVMILSELYESLLKQVAADSPGYAGEFYSPRHIIRAMVRVVRPHLRDRIYDPCFGSAGFETESADYILKTTPHMSGADLEKFHHATFYGVEFKPLSYLLGTMNMILHGIESANFELANTLELHTANVAEKNKYSVTLANPPYGGKLDRSLQTNFTIHSSATEILFVQHIMANLALGGRAGVIVPEGVLFRGGPDAKVRERLLKEFNVRTVLSLPAGCFLPYAGVKTNVLFFNREKDGKTTKDVWFYELTNDGFELKQTRRPVDGDQFPDFLAKWEKRVCGDNSWLLPLAELEKRGWDLSAKNPFREAEAVERTPLELVESIKAKQERIAELADELEVMLTS